jgi:hypothetical protein
MASLQQQGVPIPAKLNGPQNVQKPASAAPKARSKKSAAGTGKAPPRARSRKGPTGVARVRQYSPVPATDKAVAGVGLLEAEFLAALVLLVLLMFANTQASYGDKIMSIMKRGFLVCITFIILALSASIGPNAAKVSKALGGLIIVAILVTSPVVTALGTFDTFIKSDWSATDETGTQTSADSGTSSSTSGTSTNLVIDGIQTVLNTLKNLGGIL